jgi:hypothetical protein
MVYVVNERQLKRLMNEYIEYCRVTERILDWKKKLRQPVRKQQPRI